MVSTMISFFIFILTTLTLVTMIMMGVDRSATSYVQAKTMDYVDQLRTSGRVEPDDYLIFTNTLGKTGSYSVEVKVRRRMAYGDATGVVNDKITVTDQQLRDYLFGYYDAVNQRYVNRTYMLNKDDDVEVTIRRIGPGLTAMASPLGLQGKTGDLICQYEGLVEHDGIVR